MSYGSVSKLRSDYSELFSLVDDVASPIEFIPRFREFGVYRGRSEFTPPSDVLDVINFCPFTGRNLPHSLRDVYFNEIERLGFYSIDDKNLPRKYLSDIWWSSDFI